MDIALVYNPVSGSGAGQRAAGRARAELERRGYAVLAHPTSRDEPTIEIARRAAARVDRVIAMGGDGTVTDVAAGILAAGRDVPLAVVPVGTANILALNLGIPDALDAAIDLAVGGRIAPIDVGRVNGEVFLLTVSTGLHAEMVARADRESKRRWGVAAYGMAGWKANQEVEPARHRVTCDGVNEEFEVTMMQVMNCGAVFRRAWELAPGISPIDGRLDVLAYRAASIPEYMLAATQVLRGAPTTTDLVEHRRAVRVTIATDPPVRVQRDGEPAGHTPVEIDLLPLALPVVMPPDGPWVR
ncbi:MAG: diacylglycerol/lipid kinase family protein [Gemmatimonadota bacterium]